MSILKQVNLEIEHNLKLFHTKGKSVQFVVTESKKDKFKSLTLNLVQNSKEECSIELICEKPSGKAEIIIILKHISNNQTTLGRAEYFFYRFKQIAYSVQSIPGNYFCIKSRSDFTKIDITKKVLQIHDYSVEKKLATYVAKCDFPTSSKQVDFLTTKLTNLITCDAIQ